MNPIHLRSASHGAAQPLVGLSRLLLFVPLCRARFPVTGNGPANKRGQVFQYFVFFHRHRVSESGLSFNWPTALRIIG
jgi:hypothetical protein